MQNITYIYAAAIIHGLLLISVLLFGKRGNRTANLVLAVLIGLLAFALWNVFVDTKGWPSYFKLIDYYHWFSIFFWGPALYFYVGVMSRQIALNFKTILKHSALGIIFFVLHYPLQILSNTGIISSSLFEYFNSFRLLSFYIQLALYIFACFTLLTSYKNTIKQKFSSIESINLSWLQKIVGIFTILIILDTSLVVPAVLRKESIPFIEFIMLAEAIAIFAIGYFALLTPDPLIQEGKSKYDASPLDDQLSKALLNKLKTIMEKDRPYQQNNLKLADLAELVDITPHILSQVINEQCNKNFYDFINEYRAHSAAELLLKDKEKNINDIVFESGFNNRVSFNNAFKKYLGKTPSVFRHQ